MAPLKRQRQTTTTTPRASSPSSTTRYLRLRGAQQTQRPVERHASPPSILGAAQPKCTHTRKLSRRRSQSVPPLVQSATGQAIWAALRTGTIRTRPQDLLSSKEARDRLFAMMARMWATTTLTQRRQLFERLTQWCSEQGLRVSAESAVLWVMANPQLQPASQLRE